MPNAKLWHKKTRANTKREHRIIGFIVLRRDEIALKQTHARQLPTRRLHNTSMGAHNQILSLTVKCTSTHRKNGCGRRVHVIYKVARKSERQVNRKQRHMHVRIRMPNHQLHLWQYNKCEQRVLCSPYTCAYVDYDSCAYTNADLLAFEENFGWSGLGFTILVT